MLKSINFEKYFNLQDAKNKAFFKNLFEIVLVILWALWVGKEFLNLDPNQIPLGREYGMAVSTHNFWINLRECGWCALWNGSQIGGYPALANTYASVFHPITGFLTLTYGIINGSKLLVVISLVFSGIAQWWLAKELNTSWIPRMWSAGLVVVAGHLSGKLELGLVSLVFSTAMGALIFATILYVVRKQTWRSVIVLAFVITSILLSGQGYIQIGVILTIPALLFFIYKKDNINYELGKKFLYSSGIAFLLSSPFLIPLIANSSNINKSANPDFFALQPLKYTLLNYLIDDLEFLSLEIMGKWPAPNLYLLYIGWLPVLLAVFAIGVGVSQKVDKQKVLYLAGSLFLILLPIQPEFLQKVALRISAIGTIRFPSFILGITIPPILGLSAYGLDYLIKKIQWPTLQIRPDGEKSSNYFSISLVYILLIPLMINIGQAHTLSKNFLVTQNQIQGLESTLSLMETDTSQWVLPVLGEQFWTVVAVDMGFKVTEESLPWWVGKKIYPDPMFETTRLSLAEVGEFTTITNELENETVYLHANNEYAVIQTETETIPCEANSLAGQIRVTCNSSEDGTLTIYENNWKGWKAWVDDSPTEILSGDWLTVEASPGMHEYLFKYQPWDFPLGLLLMIIGIGISVMLWGKLPEEKQLEK